MQYIINLSGFKNQDKVKIFCFVFREKKEYKSKILKNRII
jgi:hypothetical protein